MRNQDANRPQRIKIIIIAVIVAILVFIFGAWLITSAIKSVEKKNQSTQTVETGKTAKKDEKNITDDKKQESTQNTSKNNNSGSNATNGNATNSPATQYSVGQHNSTTVVQNTGLPTTGPEDLLPTALLIGIASFLFFKNREIREKLSLQKS